MTGSRARPAPTLAEHLQATGGTPLRPALVTALETLADTGARLAQEIARAALTDELGETGDVNAHGDRVKRLDVRARILEVVITHYDQRTPWYIGSAEEVAWAERCVQEAGG